jgi:hypothetical protein
MPLDHHDREALFALLARTHRLQEAVKIDQKIVQEATARIIQANVKTNQAVAALAVFGIEKPESGNIWDAVRDALGQETYNAALEVGKRPEGESLSLPSPEKFTDGEDGLEDGPSDDPDVLAEAASPKISDAILELLTSKWPTGVKVADVKSFLKNTYNIETHEKTPGMTLYRLSQQSPPLVRRDKRVWFLASDPNAKAQGDLIG